MICHDLHDISFHCEIPFFIQSCRYEIKIRLLCQRRREFSQIATELGLTLLNEHPLKYARHPLVYLVEAADDICYQMMDIEDAHKLKILTTEETKELLMAYFNEERQAHIQKTFHIVNDTNEQIAYLRSSVIGLLIRECTRVFLEHEQKYFPAHLKKHLSNISPNVRQSLQALCRSFDQEDLQLTRCTGHRVSRLPGYQYPT